MTQTVIFRGSLLYSYTAQKQVEDFMVRDTGNNGLTGTEYYEATGKGIYI